MNTVDIPARDGGGRRAVGGCVVKYERGYIVGKFDGLADDYDRSRPRYPKQLFERAVQGMPRGGTVADAGAGTGIALETLVPLLPVATQIVAVDVSQDMVRIGRDKFPTVTWRVGEAEQILPALEGVDLVVSAQAYQWMDRPRFLNAVHKCLRPGGRCLIMQNNRDYTRPGFAADYEGLLEDCSPGYRRDYRAINIKAELSAVFSTVETTCLDWVQPMTVDQFVTMSSSSTQVQRAVEAVGPGFLAQVRALADAHAAGGNILLPYRSESYTGWLR